MSRNCNAAARGVTLLELLLAVALLTLVALAAVVSEMLGERIVHLTRNRSVAQHEAQVAMEHMFNRLRPANLIEIVSASPMLVRARIDYDINSVPLQTPETTGDDTYFWYAHDPVAATVAFAHTPTSAAPGLFDQVVGRYIADMAVVLSGIECQVALTAQKENESVDLHSAIALRCMPGG